MFRPTISTIIRRYDNNITGKAEEADFALQYYKPEIITFVPGNNEMLKLRSVSMKISSYKVFYNLTF
jgi:hypothetical protein